MEQKGLIINIGRQFGSGGRAVALEIGRLLGVKVYDNELLTKAAEASGFSPELFRRNDEKKRFFAFFHFFSAHSVGLGNGTNCIDEGALFKIQSEVIEDIAAHEAAVIVGRCSDYILRERGNTLDVFISAPLEDRIQRVMERNYLTREKAADLIRTNDRKRESYYNYFTFGNWGVASNYDLCVDSSILGIEKTAQYIIDFARQSGRLQTDE
ncbi:MAG: cytidylate kinase-like family protein [Bacteroidales bacterium]|nr:cytidylate kinase-like family protein [Bacteroidales bacterium]